MKNIINAFLLIFPILIIGQTKTENYIKTTSYQSPIQSVPDDEEYEDYTTSLSSDIFWSPGGGQQGGASGTIAITNNVLSISFSGSWSSTSRLRVGFIKPLQTTPALQDIELGPITTSPGNDSGYFAKIKDNNLIFYSPYYSTGIQTTLSNSISTTTNLSQTLSGFHECPGTGNEGGSSGNITLENGEVSLDLSAGWNYNCNLKLGQIQYLNTVPLPDTELGVIKNNLGIETIYRAKIEDNYLVFYASEPIRPPVSGVNTAYSINLQNGIPNNQKIESVSYFDGLGRPKQSIALRAGGQEQDIITPIEYDPYGRQDKEYLSFAKTTQNGAIVPNVIAELNEFYARPKYENTSNPYAQKSFETSPLNRIQEQAAPGNDWALANDHTIKFDWKTNESQDSIPYFKTHFVDPGNTEIPSLVQEVFYNPNELYSTIIKDENWKSTDGKLRTTEEFKDKQGRVILKRTYMYLQETQEIVPVDTYYVHDDFGNLTYVIPPKVNTLDGVSNSELVELCYQYRYDYRNRLIEKRIPGKDWEFIVYDKLDRPVLTQDANQRLAYPVEWSFTKYDVFGRIVFTGIFKNFQTREFLQSIFNAKNTAEENYEEKVTSGTGFENSYYTNTNFPSANIEVLTTNYYDDYNFDSVGFSNTNSVYDQQTTSQTKSLTTGSKVKVLETNEWITNVIYYDHKARPVYVASKNTYLNTIDIITSELDFIGNVLKTRSIHQKNTDPSIVIVDTFTYDHMNRLLTHRQCIGDDSLPENCEGTTIDIEPTIVLSTPITETQDVMASSQITLTEGFSCIATGDNTFTASIGAANANDELIVANTYDELGQLASKEVGGGLQKIDYTYNIRGWLTQINDPMASLGDDLFAFKINYNNTTEGLQANALYNGNISETIWKTASDNTKRAYGYQYDALNRITNAKSTSGNYDLSNVSYDKNGNLLHLIRNGWQNSNTYSGMDGLSYEYDAGNKLMAVSDEGSDEGSEGYGFFDRNQSGNDYDYDPNGNMTIDLNKGIAGITYNHLNLPTTVYINNEEGNGDITYIYDATGTKLKKIVTEGSSLIETEYAGNYVYKNGSLEFFNQPEGYVEKEADGYKYIYQFKDHLDNVRLSYKDANKDGTITQDEIVQEKNYYPFGLTHKGYNETTRGRNHQYGFGGKEEQDELGLDWIDITARNYDPALGRWMNIDPLAEQMRRHSPYNYGFDNPIYYIDPDGMISCPWGDCSSVVRLFQNADKWLENNEIVFDVNIGLDFKIGFGLSGSIGNDSSKVGFNANAKLFEAEIFDTQGSLVEGEQSFETDFATKDGELEVKQSVNFSVTYGEDEYVIAEGENSFTAYDDYQRTYNHVQKLDFLEKRETTSGSMDVDSVTDNPNHNPNHNPSASTGSGKSSFSASNSNTSDSAILKFEGKGGAFFTFGTSFEIGFRKKKK